jgi:predicted permease
LISALAAVLAPTFICAGLGFGWSRLGRPYDTRLVTALILSFGTPCLVFSTLTRLHLSLSSFGSMAGAAVLALASFAIVGALVLRAARLPFHTYLPALTFGNSGNMGLPVCLFAFGETGLALAIAFFAVGAISNFTFGVWLSSGTMSPAAMLRTPMIYAVAVSVAFMAFDIEAPAWLANTTRLIGGMTIPLMLVTLGVTLAELRVTAFGRALALSILRLSMGFLVGFGLAGALGFEGVARGVLIIECAMPVAVFNFLFAKRYNRAPSEVAGMVLISTVVALALLPLLLAVVV